MPLHNLDGIVVFGYKGTSPALMGACVDRNISLCYVTSQGKFLARVTGKVKGNIILRRQQYYSSLDEKKAWKFQKIVYWVRYIMHDGFWREPLEIMQCR